MKHIDNPLMMERVIIKRAYTIAGFPLIYSLLSGHFSQFFGFISGLLITTLFLRFKLKGIKYSLELQREKAEVFIRNRNLLEYSVYLVLLALAIRHPQINFLALVIGLFIIRITVLGMLLLDLLRERLGHEF